MLTYHRGWLSECPIPPDEHAGQFSVGLELLAIATLLAIFLAETS